MSPSSCPHFDSCTAPVCPLDAEWRKRTMLKGESVCRFIRAIDRGECAAAEAADVSMQVVQEQIGAFPYIANELRKEAARRERDSHHPKSGVDGGACLPLPEATTPFSTTHFSGLHHPVAHHSSEASQ